VTEGVLSYAGGGVAFGPKPRSYAQRTPKKMIRLALHSALSDRAAEGRVVLIDEWSFANALENARLNGVSGLFTVLRGDLSVVPDSCFDLIGANIQKNVIEEMLPGLVSRLAPRGTLLLSGLLAEDRESMTATLAGEGLSPTEEQREGEDGQLDSSIQAAEIAYKMQSEAPEVFDISKEPEAVRARYGDNDFARGCLMARRLVCRGWRNCRRTQTCPTRW
jgi:hypothetical protein